MKERTELVESNYRLSDQSHGGKGECNEGLRSSLGDYNILKPLTRIGSINPLITEIVNFQLNRFKSKWRCFSAVGYESEAQDSRD